MSKWKLIKLNQIASINPTQLKSNTEPDFEFDYIDISSIESTGKIKNTKKLKFSKAPSRARRRVEINDILISTVRPYLKSFAKVKKITNYTVCSTGFVVLRVNQLLANSDFIYQYILSEKFMNQISPKLVGSNYPSVNSSDVGEVILEIPPLKEQQKIADILTSVDEAIEKTEAIIKQTETVKKGLMQQLLTKGIGHTKFKQTEIGEIPEEWEITELGNLFTLIKRPLKMTDEQEYQLVTVKRRQEGIVSRGILKGKEILVKSQFTIKEGDFLISKRQIVHGACEIVPKNLDNSIVSNEYNILKPSDNLDVHYLRWLSRTPLLMKYFLLSSIGVHIEKMLFKIDDWFKRKIALPPLEEQFKISKTLNSLQESIDSNRAYLEKLDELKNGLMQSLLTGKVRVNVDESEVLPV